MRASDPVVFSQEWFQRHQRVLLALLRTPVIGRELRDVLAIRRHDVGFDRRIVSVQPDHYIVDNGDGTYTLDVRTHAKFATRLRYQLDGLWQAAHAWDMHVANPMLPALNVGFDTLTQYPDPANGATTVDGTVTRQAGNEAWATIIAGAGSFSGTTGAQDIFFNFNAGTVSNTYDNLYRSVFTLDTSALTSAAAITAATFSLYGSAKLDTFSVAPTADLYGATPSVNNDLVGSDFSQCGATSYTGSPLTYAGWSIAGYNDFALNATGRAAISKTGITRFAVRNANYDVAAVAPIWTASAQSYIYGYFADQTGSTNDPKLLVTYDRNSLVLSPNKLRPRVFAPGRTR